MLCCYDNLAEDQLELDAKEDSDSSVGLTRKRSCTDISALIVMAVFFALLIPLLGYSMANGDIDRLINGYDDCGNVCGKDNKKTDSIPFECFGKNMTQKKFLLTIQHVKDSGLNNVTKTCVESCNTNENNKNYVDFSNRCVDKSIEIDIRNLLNEISEDFQLCWKQMTLLSIFATVWSIIMMVLFRYATAFTVWFILVGSAALFFGGSTYLWILYSSSGNNDVVLYYAILATVCTAIILLLIFVMIHRIKLIIQLFKESAKAIAAMPQLLFQPLWTFIAFLIILFCGFYFSLWIITSGDLQTTDDNIIYDDQRYLYPLNYGQNMFTQLTKWYNYFAMLWMIQFVIGCQHMIVAGCVATWFFSSNKDNLGSPVITSTLNVIKYHLGTIALGSLIIAIVQAVKAIIRMVTHMKNRRNIIIYIISWFLRNVLEWIEVIVKYFSRNAYIQTAIHGHSFCYGGKKAFKLLMNNIFKVAAINSVGDFILFLTKMYITIGTVLIGFEIFRFNEEINNLWFPLITIGIISYLIAHCFIAVYEMIIDTIFLCFCEDCELNQGFSRTFYMSRNLMEYIENSNKTFNSKNWSATDQQIWDNGPKRLLKQES